MTGLGSLTSPLVSSFSFLTSCHSSDRLDPSLQLIHSAITSRYCVPVGSLPEMHKSLHFHHLLQFILQISFLCRFPQSLAHSLVFPPSRSHYALYDSALYTPSYWPMVRSTFPHLGISLWGLSHSSLHRHNFAQCMTHSRCSLVLGESINLPLFSTSRA